MKLNELIKPPKAARKPKKRKGRGAGSGLGKTAGRGHNGQNSRSGGGVPAWFEGGQMPIARRLPKFGFTNIFKKEYAIVNLDTLEKLDIKGEITPQTLVEKGVIKKNLKLKVLGKGELSNAITIKASRFSATAAAKIEKAGGKAVVA